MSDAPQWHLQHPAFIDVVRSCLNRLDDCLTHLLLIGQDADAVVCAQRSLAQLSEQATLAGVLPIAQHCRSLSRLIRLAHISTGLTPPVLNNLRSCLNLLAWQVELIDPKDGTLLLDGLEQQALVDALAASITPVDTQPRSTGTQADLFDKPKDEARQAV